MLFYSSKKIIRKIIIFYLLFLIPIFIFDVIFSFFAYIAIQNNQNVLPEEITPLLIYSSIIMIFLFTIVPVLLGGLPTILIINYFFIKGLKLEVNKNFVNFGNRYYEPRNINEIGKQIVGKYNNSELKIGWSQIKKVFLKNIKPWYSLGFFNINYFVIKTTSNKIYAATTNQKTAEDLKKYILSINKNILNNL